MPETKDRNGQRRKWLRPVLVIAFILIAVFGAVVMWMSITTPRGEAIARIAESKDGQGMLPNEQKPLGDLVLLNYREYRDNTVRWSAAYYSCLFLAAVFSALAGFVLKLKSFSNAAVLKEDLAALLALTAALLITLSTVGDFQRKWHANRIAASDTEGLAYGLLKTPFTEEDKATVISRLQEISATRNREIVGENKPALDTQSSPRGNNNRSGENSNRSGTPDSNATSNTNSNANTRTRAQVVSDTSA